MLRKTEWEMKNKSVTNTLLEEVSNGIYPAKRVNKMDMASLEKFVVRLVEYTSVWASAKIEPSTSRHNMTNWWSLLKDILVDKQRNKKSNKEFRHNLKKVVISCSEFFQNCGNDWHSHSTQWTNDENFDVIQTRKRKSEHPFEVPLPKKRKTLLTYAKKEFTEKPLIYFSRYPPESDELNKSLTQTEFLRLFKLGLNNNEMPRSFASNNFRTNRLLNCPHIPFSSDIGQLMIKKENCTVPSYVSERKLDRLEWYLNKNSTTLSDLQYQLAYVPSKNTPDHFYHFPVKKFGQTRGDVQLKTFIYSLCKPLTVLLNNEDLTSLKSHYDKIYKVNVSLPKLTDKQPKKKTRKKTTVKLIDKDVILNENELRQTKVLIANEKKKSTKRPQSIRNKKGSTVR